MIFCYLLIFFYGKNVFIIGFFMTVLGRQRIISIAGGFLKHSTNYTSVRRNLYKSQPPSGVCCCLMLFVTAVLIVFL